jgi:hypothetical protein
VFAARLERTLAVALPEMSGVAGGATGMSTQAMAQMPPAARAAYASAFTGSLNTVFLVAACVCAIGFLLTWLMPERPLRATAASGWKHGSERSLDEYLTLAVAGAVPNARRGDIGGG